MGQKASLQPAARLCAAVAPGARPSQTHHCWRGQNLNSGPRAAPQEGTSELAILETDPPALNPQGHSETPSRQPGSFPVGYCHFLRHHFRERFPGARESHTQTREPQKQPRLVSLRGGSCGLPWPPRLG